MALDVHVAGDLNPVKRDGIPTIRNHSGRSDLIAMARSLLQRGESERKLSRALHHVECCALRGSHADDVPYLPRQRVPRDTKVKCDPLPSGSFREATLQGTQDPHPG